MIENRIITAFIVDDEELIASTLATILNLSGFRANHYSSADAALSDAAEFGPPDILITDVAMPGMTGVELALHFKIHYPDCKVLLFSGHASTVDLLSKARVEGHNFAILAKPVHPKDLIAAIGGLTRDSLPSI
jgi:FixJ family two-component response regulator